MQQAAQRLDNVGSGGGRQAPQGRVVYYREEEAVDECQVHRCEDSRHPASQQNPAPRPSSPYCLILGD